MVLILAISAAIAIACASAGETAPLQEELTPTSPAGISEGQLHRLDQISRQFDTASSQLYLPAFLPAGFELWLIQEIHPGEFEFTYQAESSPGSASFRITQATAPSSRETPSSRVSVPGEEPGTVRIDRFPLTRTLHFEDGTAASTRFEGLGFNAAMAIDGNLISVRGLGGLEDGEDVGFVFTDALVREILDSLFPFSPGTS